MPILNRASELQVEASEWRRHLHQNPELLYDVHETAAFVAAKLAEFGVDEIVTGIGKTGVVGIIRGNRPGERTIGLRADMDALPVEETTGKPWSSRIAGKMHACGHDGHTAMLLGAAKYLTETRNFAGNVALIFQPAEEGGAGALAMIEDGLTDRFGIDEVYGMHNMPGIPAGHFATRSGGIMAAPDKLAIRITGRGGHAAQPHGTIDPVLVGAQLVTALQTIASRNTDPLRAVVVSITRFNAGSTHNVIPDEAFLTGTVRTLDENIRDTTEARIRQIAAGICAAHGAQVEVQYERTCPVTVNHEANATLAINVAADIVGPDCVNGNVDPSMAGEDFSYMLNARPGAFVFIGNGPSAGLHNPSYDFNDDIIAAGISWWVRLSESRLAG